MTTLATLKKSESFNLVGRDAAAILRSIGGRLHQRYERWRQHRHLLSLNDHLLRDIGISRADLAHGMPVRRAD